MRSYKQINSICGWIVFAIAAIVYVCTVEPSASFWDCAEFISSGAKLEVGHPPGAPFFMLAANLFSNLANDTSNIAYMVNIMNALLSAGCILFLFWSITHLARRLTITADETTEISPWQTVVLMGSGAVGALAYTFSDTFWFSAVEGEVYAFSSFFTALAFWIMLKWEDEAHQQTSDRWIVLLAYIIGLSIGVHLLNLLCIPAIGWIFYYRKWKYTTLKGTLVSLFVSILLIGIVLYGMIPGVMKVAGYFELAAVNGAGLPYNSGMIVYYLLLTCTLIWGVYETTTGLYRLRMIISFLSGCLLLGITYQGGSGMTILLSIIFSLTGFWILHRLLRQFKQTMCRVLHVISLCMLVMFLGYSSYALILIRSAANTPMDQQSPEDPFALKDYLGREQYGDTPLLYGQTFNSPLALKEADGYLIYDHKKGDPQYRRQNWTGNLSRDQYVNIGEKMTLNYQSETCVWFPRMYNSSYTNAYQSWLGNIDGKAVTYYDKQNDQMKTVTIPSAWDNLRYFFGYQLNYMYWRYFLWNFVGRQNDIQGYGNLEHGNWITGFGFIDRYLTGNQELTPDFLKNNKGRNVYYALPLLLGLIGLYWQIRQGKRGTQQFNIILMLFFMTGVAIVLYLNQVPQQPRERDYAYAGSFYAFAIWMGIGTAAIAQWLLRFMSPQKATTISVLLTLCIPIQMGIQTWDDHDRSGRYICRDIGKNYLSSIPEKDHPILFVNGDNDTFPVWYSCEVEGFRRDVRSCNLMYLSGGWYVDQMKCPAYQSPGLPISFPRAYCRDGVNDVVRVNPIVRREKDATGKIREIRLKEQIQMMYQQNPKEKPFGENPFEWNNIVKYWLTSDDESMRCIPTDEVHIKVDKDAVTRSGMTIPAGIEVPDTMVISLKDRTSLTRSSLVLIDLIQQCNWKRALYVATTVAINEYLDLSDYLVQEGLASRIVPYNARKANYLTDTDKMYTNMIEKFKYEGLNEPVYLDETNQRMVLSLQRNLSSLAEQLYLKGDTIRAEKVLDFSCEAITSDEVILNTYSATSKMGILYGALGKPQKGFYLWNKAYCSLEQYALWYASLSERQFSYSLDSYLRTLYAMHQMLQEAIQNRLITNNKIPETYLKELQIASKKLQHKEYANYLPVVNELIEIYTNK